ncbi:hypothetical protein I316_01332 [Kwoniella heveanensis BCC8398]|uniref:Etoposide-induced protein 2.4 (EI24) n=1 Tax=Kwoniella heveanensis BCC8398 TaxID=1296120 RepID=A0A1B9H0D3_9TREE|nr:hypothetical protein I316_01332 [Kwoniella heveanensis BCC8398]
MLHRRPTASASVGVSSTTSGPGTPPRRDSSNSNTNTAYRPLRRQSANLYPNASQSTPSAFSNPDAPSARYTLPIPSPLNISSGSYAAPASSSQQGLAYGNSYQPNGYGFSSGPGPGYVAGYEGGGGGGGRRVVDFSAEGMKRIISDFVDNVGAGLRDGLKLEKSWNLVWSDRELRTLVLKSTMINLLSLLLLSLSSLIFSPLLVHPISPTMETRTKEIGMWYNILLSWPVFVVCFWVNASWGPSISRRAQSTLHPSHRFQPSPASTPTSATPSSFSSKKADLNSSPYSWVFTAVARILLISDFTLVSRLIGMTPLVGRLAAFAYMCVIDAYYFFEWNFLQKHWPLDHRIQYMQDRTAYMFGFGLPATFITSFGPPLVKMAVFALIYPFFVLQAIQSRPPSSSAATLGSGGTGSLLPTTPSPHASLPPSPVAGDLNSNDPFLSFQSNPAASHSYSSASDFSASSWKIPGTTVHVRIPLPLKLPIFWLASYALIGVKWLEIASARDRTRLARDSNGAGSLGLGLRGINVKSFVGKERPGKRAY